MNGERAPSPWLFAVALPLALAAGILLMWRAAGVERIYTDRFFDTARLRRLEPPDPRRAPPAPLRVVALGSSLISYGLVYDGTLEAMAAAAGHPVRFVP